MNDRARVLKQLVGNSIYSVDQHAVADAIVLRASLRRSVPELPFRGSFGRQPGLSLARNGALRPFGLNG